MSFAFASPKPSTRRLATVPSFSTSSLRERYVNDPNYKASESELVKDLEEAGSVQSNADQYKNTYTVTVSNKVAAVTQTKGSDEFKIYNKAEADKIEAYVQAMTSSTQDPATTSTTSEGCSE